MYCCCLFQGGFFNAITGAGGVKVDIRFTPTDQQKQSTGAIVPIDHYPTWKLNKNPFWRVKHPNSSNNNNNRMASVAPAPIIPGDPNSFMAAQERTIFAYEQHQDVGGVVTLHLAPGKKIEHLGIKIQFIGRIDMSMGVNEGRPHYDFVSLSKELSPPGILYQSTTEIPFFFRNMDKEHESYRGRNVSVRYFVKVIVERKFLPPLQKEHDIWIQVLGQAPAQNEAIKMEVGIEDCLHIEFEYERRVYHLQDTILGNIHFLLVRIKIKHMELAVIRRETSGERVAAITSPTAPGPQIDNGSNIFTETQTLVKYEIMDGAPVKGEVIPVKLSMCGIPADLTPTYSSVNNRFSVRYFLNLVLVDEEDRRYFKQQEIILWRKELG
ncbi:MAG: vacuolar protein sorting-associated protein 26 [Bacillariaceae sp.]